MTADTDFCSQVGEGGISCREGNAMQVRDLGIRGGQVSWLHRSEQEDAPCDMSHSHSDSDLAVNIYTLITVTHRRYTQVHSVFSTAQMAKCLLLRQWGVTLRLLCAVRCLFRSDRKVSFVSLKQTYNKDINKRLKRWYMARKASKGIFCQSDLFSSKTYCLMHVANLAQRWTT